MTHGVVYVLLAEKIALRAYHTVYPALPLLWPILVKADLATNTSSSSSRWTAQRRAESLGLALIATNALVKNYSLVWQPLFSSWTKPLFLLDPRPIWLQTKKVDLSGWLSPTAAPTPTLSRFLIVPNEGGGGNSMFQHYWLWHIALPSYLTDIFIWHVE